MTDPRDIPDFREEIRRQEQEAELRRRAADQAHHQLTLEDQAQRARNRQLVAHFLGVMRERGYPKSSKIIRYSGFRLEWTGLLLGRKLRKVRGARGWYVLHSDEGGKVLLTDGRFFPGAGSQVLDRRDLRGNPRFDPHEWVAIEGTDCTEEALEDRHLEFWLRQIIEKIDRPGAP